jgi:BMFP domain-containing protein YqiC
MPNNTQLIDNLVDKVSTLLGSSPVSENLKADVQHNVRALIQSAFSQLNMVSREEFEAQVEVLHRTRSKIDELEKQLADLNTQSK